MRQTHQTPLTPNLSQATQQKPAETTRFFNLTKYRFHGHFPSGIQGAPFRALDFRCHALLGCGGRLSPRSVRYMVSLTARGHVGIKSTLLYTCCRRLTVIAAVIGGRNLL